MPKIRPFDKTLQQGIQSLSIFPKKQKTNFSYVSSSVHCNYVDKLSLSFSVIGIANH